MRARFAWVALVAGCASTPKSSAPRASPPTEVTVPSANEDARSSDDPGAPPSAVESDERKRVDPDGLVVEELAAGSGAEAKAGDQIVVHYDGTLTDGSVFDSSRTRGTPFVFQLGRGHVIPGFERGVTGMRPGGRRRIIVPPALGYGSSGAGQKIPPDSVLVFELELLEIRDISP